MLQSRNIRCGSCRALIYWEEGNIHLKELEGRCRDCAKLLHDVTEGIKDLVVTED